MFLSHYRAGTGAVLVTTREESRCLASLLAELPQTADVCSVAAPGGPLKAVRCRPGSEPAATPGIAAGYAWAAAAPGRVLVVYDWHMLANNPGQWRMLLEALPGLRCPRGSTDTSPASLVVFMGPSWELQPVNPLRSSIPILDFAPPTRSEIAAIADSMRPLGEYQDAAPLGNLRESVADALCGLSADSAAQAAAECLAACSGWDIGHLRASKRKMISDAGMQVVPGILDIGGLEGFKSYAQTSIVPWVRDETLGVRRVFFGGTPGTGKTFTAAYLAGLLGCDLFKLDLGQLQAKYVGESQAATRAATTIFDAVGTEAPAVVLMDEIDCIAKTGNDGGAASGQWSWMTDWLQRTLHHQTIVIAASNYPDRVDDAMMDRFPIRFAFSHPCAVERADVALIHYKRVGIAEPERAAELTAQLTEGCNCRQLAEIIIPEVTRLTARKPADTDLIRQVVSSIIPAANVQSEQLAKMRAAVAGWRTANNPPRADSGPTGRRIV